MNKRGQGLPLTTVIIAILVILVLVIVIVFFLGGMRSVTEKIKSIFSKTVSGSDLNFAIQTCQTYCDQAKLLPTADLKKKSAYCTSSFNIDMDNNGEAEKTTGGEYKKYYCFKPSWTVNDNEVNQYLSVDCPDLGVDCPKP